MDAEAAVCETFCQRMKAAIRAHLIDWDTYTFQGNCQGAQAVGIFYGAMTEEEQEDYDIAIQCVTTALNRMLDDKPIEWD